MDIRYAMGSIKDVIIPSLKRLHKDVTKEESIPRDIYLAFNGAISDIVKSKTYGEDMEGKQPLILEDVVRVIERSPALIPSKNEETSLWLIAISTGARAFTCEHVNVEDIVDVCRDPLLGHYYVKLLYRFTKGNHNWRHVVTIEGHLDRHSSTDAVYWLNKHLNKSFNLELAEYDTWNNTCRGKKLWRWSKDSMRELLKDRLKRAGYPEDMFCFHSLRSGFICSALLKAGKVVLLL
jgi:hypothetical protein